MSKIELSSSLYQRLLRRAVSFDDTAEDVIARLLAQAEGRIDSKKEGDAFLRNEPPVPPGSVLSLGEYWLPILSIIDEAGGSAPANEVIAALEERMGEVLRNRDRDRL